MDRYEDIGGVSLHFTETGNPAGAPVVLMHGWGCTIATVESIARSLEDTRRVISVDLPGHGASSEPPLLPDGQAWGVYEYAALVKELIERLGLESPALVGHSYGGRIAIILGATTPVEKIVLVDSAGIKPRRPLKYYLKVYPFKVARVILPVILGEKRGGRIIERWRNRAGSADYRNSSPIMKMVMSRSVNQDLRHHLPNITVPTLLIWGENDTATPIADARLMESLIPDAGLVSIKGAGHYSYLDNPGQFRAVIRSFLA